MMPAAVLLVSSTVSTASCSLVTTHDAHFTDASVQDADASSHRDAGHDSGPRERCTEPGLECRPPAPSGWSGPIVLVTGSGDSDAPPCPSVAPTSKFTTHSGLTADPANCGCTCANPDPSVMGCSGVNISPSCGILINGVTVPSGGCTTHASTASDAPWHVAESTFMALGECNPQPTVSVPPPTWSASHRACSFGEPVPCAHGVCAPAALADGERFCVFVEGTDVSNLSPGVPVPAHHSRERGRWTRVLYLRVWNSRGFM